MGTVGTAAWRKGLLVLCADSLGCPRSPRGCSSWHCGHHWTPQGSVSARETQSSLPCSSPEQDCLPGSARRLSLLSHRASSSQELLVRRAQTRQTPAQVQTRTLVPLITSKCSVIWMRDSDQLEGQNEAVDINDGMILLSERKDFLCGDSIKKVISI